MVLVQGVRQSVLACGAVRAVAVLPRVYADVRCLVTSLVNCTHTLSDSLTRSITRSLTHSHSHNQIFATGLYELVKSALVLMLNMDVPRPRRLEPGAQLPGECLA